MTANGVVAWVDPEGDGIAVATLNSAAGSPGANSVTTGTIVDATITGADLSSTIALPSGATATTQTATDSSTKLATTAYVMAKPHALVMAKSGVIGATETDAADFHVVVPFDMTLTAMKATVKTAVSGAMVVQLRLATATITTLPTWSNVSGWTCTFSNTNILATNAPSTTTVGVGDVLNFSCSTGSGTNLLVELVGTLR